MKLTGMANQQGAVLIVSLVILLILTLLGVSSINLTLLQERMVGNTQDQQQAFQAAEAALRDGERDVLDNMLSSTVFYADCTHGLCQPTNSGKHVWQSNLIDWVDGTNTIAYGQNTNAADLPGVAQQPRYIIERLHVTERGNSLKRGLDHVHRGEWYRITAVGYGIQGRVAAMVQSVYQK